MLACYYIVEYLIYLKKYFSTKITLNLLIYNNVTDLDSSSCSEKSTKYKNTVFFPSNIHLVRQNSSNKFQFLLQIAVIAAWAVTALASPVYESQSYIQSTSGSVISRAPTLSQSPVLTYAQEPLVTYSQAPLAVAHAPVEVEHYVRIPF